MCTSYVLYAYLYCIYALVGGEISIHDLYICAISRVCANESHAVFHRRRCLCSENVAIGFTLAKKFIRGEKSSRTSELLEIGILRHHFWMKHF